MSSVSIQIESEECEICIIPSILKDLSCNHSLCLDCINKIKKDGLIKCPFCRSFSKIITTDNSISFEKIDRNIAIDYGYRELQPNELHTRIYLVIVTLIIYSIVNISLFLYVFSANYLILIITIPLVALYITIFLVLIKQILKNYQTSNINQTRQFIDIFCRFLMVGYIIGLIFDLCINYYSLSFMMICGNISCFPYIVYTRFTMVINPVV